MREYLPFDCYLLKREINEAIPLGYYIHIYISFCQDTFFEKNKMRKY